MGDHGRLRLSGAVESTWLAAVVVVPLLFNAHSADPFELQKVAMLRSLALAGAALWATRSLFPGGGTRRRESLPWVVLAAAHLGVLGLSVSFSVDGRASLFGSSLRHQGLLTEGAYVVFFLLLLRGLRDGRQIERLVDAALLGSFPVALYGVIQRFGADPMTWSDDVSVRVTSSLGNPIFLGGFLILVVPLAVYRHVRSARELAGGEPPSVKAALLGGSAASLGIQIAAWSLGPLIGTLAATVTLVFWWGEATLLGASPRAAGLLGVYNVLLSAQLAALVLSGSRGPLLGLVVGLGFLLLMWAVGQRRKRLVVAVLGLGAVGALTVALANARSSPLEIPDVGRLGRLLDRTGRIRVHIWQAAGRALAEHPERLWTGFGPETLHLVAARHFTPEPGGRQRGALPDRAHNDAVERLATSGVPGLAVHFLWWTFVLGGGIQAARGRSRETRRAFLSLWLLGGALGALLARALDGSWRLSAPAASLGLLAGAAAYLGWRGLARPRGARGWSERRWLAAALTSALAAHFVELQFGIGVTSTRLYAWVFAACLAVVAGRGRLRVTSPDAGRKTSLVTLVLGTLACGFLSPSPERLLAPSVLWLFASTWILGGVAVQCSPGPKGPPRLRRYALATLVPLAALLVVQSAWRIEGRNALEPYAGFVLVWIAVTGTTRRARREPRRTPAILARGVLVGSAVLLVLGPTLDAVRADADLGRARLHRSKGELELAERFARRALERRPEHDLYLFELGRIVFERASRPGNDDRIAEAAKLLERACALSPLDPRPMAALSQVYAAWAEETKGKELREARFERALASSDAALEAFPANPLFWNERAVTLALAGEPAEAEEALFRSLEVDDRFVETYLRLGELQRAAGRLSDAAATYERALSHAPASIEVLRALASTDVAMGRAGEAVTALERIVARRPDDAAAHLDLALLLDAGGDRERARSHAELAIEHAPPGELETIESLVSSIVSDQKE